MSRGGRVVRADRKPVEQAAAAAGPRAARPFVDRAALEYLQQLQSPGEPDLVQELTDLFLSEAPRHQTAIRAAVTERDHARLEMHSHTLKGSCQNLGVRPGAEVCGRLEALARRESGGGEELVDELDGILAVAFEELRSYNVSAAEPVDRRRAVAGVPR